MEHFRKRYVKTRFWNTEKNPSFFPELHDEDFSSPYVSARSNFGVCFSGGGTRSASATLGQLRGLKEAGLLEKIGYISAVSGGSWGSAPFIFLPEEKDEGKFLGKYVPPEDLSMDDYRQCVDGSLAKAISETKVLDDAFVEILSLAGDESYSRAIGSLFLKPFGLGNKEQSVAFDEKNLHTILADNSNKNDVRYFLDKKDFIVPRQGRPFFIACSTLLRKGNDNIKKKKMLCEYTPMYTGVRKYFPDAGRRKFIIGGKRPVGGGYIQTFAYDAHLAEKEVVDGCITVKSRRNNFTLSDIIGSSGAAPEETVRKVGLNFVGFPEFRHFPIPQVNNGKVIDDEEYAHGDGGHLENLGIMPLLARKVRNIVVFVNTLTPFKASKEDQRKRKFPSRDFTDDLAPLFGIDNLPSQHQGKYDEVKLAVNQIFEPNKFHELLQAYDACKKEGNPLVHSDTYQVLENSHYLIPRYKAKICWVYLDNVQSWIEQIGDTELKNILASRQDRFIRFPNFKTFGENIPSIIDLHSEQVNMLAHLTSWVVMTNKDTILSE